MRGEDFVNALRAWQNFYLLTGGAAATLAGLMFVAVTFGAGLVGRESLATARGFIDPTFAQFLQVLLTGCVLVIPTLGPRVLGVLVLLVGVGRCLGLVWVYRHLRRAHEAHQDLEFSDWLFAITLPLVAYLLIVASGLGFIVGRSEAFTGLAVATVALLGIGVWSAWELLVWMAGQAASRREPPG
jgi:hypothetical protein